MGYALLAILDSDSKAVCLGVRSLSHSLVFAWLLVDLKGIVRVP